MLAVKRACTRRKFAGHSRVQGTGLRRVCARLGACVVPDTGLGYAVNCGQKKTRLSGFRWGVREPLNRKDRTTHIRHRVERHRGEFAPGDRYGLRSL